MRDDDKLVRQLSLVAFLMSLQRPVTAGEIHEALQSRTRTHSGSVGSAFRAGRLTVSSVMKSSGASG